LIDPFRHITEQDRFFTDFAAEEKKRREEQALIRQQQLTTRRAKLVEAEEQRWNQIDKEWAAFQAREEAKKNKGTPRNKSSVPYNPLTLQYDDTTEGQKLRHADEQIRHRAALRAERLQAHETKDGINPITGEKKELLKVPAPPKFGQ